MFGFSSFQIKNKVNIRNSKIKMFFNVCCLNGVFIIKILNSAVLLKTAGGTINTQREREKKEVKNK